MKNYLLALALSSSMLLMGQQQPGTPVPPTQSVPAAPIVKAQCTATTKAGHQCKRKAKADGKLCGQHQNTASKGMAKHIE